MAGNIWDAEIERYRAKTEVSRLIQQKAQQFLPGGSSRGTAFFDPYPIFVDRGEGHHIYDVDGNRYLDFMINATSLIMGHAPPELVRVIQDQIARGTAYGGPTESQVRLAEILSNRIPSVETIRFTNSGTEGTLMAIRAARAFTGRYKIAKFEGGYHGSHEYVSVSVGPPADKLDSIGPTAISDHPGQPPSVLDDVIVLPFNDLEKSERKIRENASELACVIMEPISSRFGYAPAELHFLEGVRSVTEELGIVLIFDEVQSFRVAPGGAQEVFNVIPDMTTLGKIIGGGLPVGAFGGREDIMSVFDPSAPGETVPHAGTFNANPTTMVAGEFVMNNLTREVYERLAFLGESLRMKMRSVFDELDVPVQITGVASLFGIHLAGHPIIDHRSMIQGDLLKRKTLFLGLINEGMWLQASCAGALNILSTENEIDNLVEATRTVMHRVR
ncbi:aspartate aminotransferase family protein [SAR202 cluster bacterium AD-804-J14_MRT_500m]|nr:aspartate aminotransferase family protein [SAR202 cluster bacterium AD-804-J14_MRT_500m]